MTATGTLRAAPSPPASSGALFSTVTHFPGRAAHKVRMSIIPNAARPIARQNGVDGQPLSDNPGNFGFRVARAESDVTLNARGFVDDNPVGGLDADGLLFHSRKIAKPIGHSMGLNAWDVEDLAQDALVEVLKKQKGSGAIIHGGLLRRQVGYSASKVSLKLKNQNSTDAGARGAWLKECAKREQALGRDLTVGEKNIVAKEIQASRGADDPRHVPSDGFQWLSTDAPIDAEDSRVGATLSSAEQSYDSDEDDAYRLADEVKHGVALVRGHGDTEAKFGPRIGVKAARRQAWNALAKAIGAPPAGVATVPGAVAAKAALTVPDAVDVAARWIDEEGVTTQAEVDAFFLPYGRINKDQMTAVATMIADRPQLIGVPGEQQPQGHAYWSAALECANAASYPRR